MSLLQSLLRAAQRFEEVGRVALLTSVLMPVGSYLAVQWWPDVVALIGAALGVNLIVLTLLRVSAAQYVPFTLRPVFWQADRVREMAAFSGWSSAAGAVTSLMLQIDRLCVAALGPVSGVTYYAVPAQLASRVNLLGAVSTSLFFSRSGWLHSQDRLTELSQQHAAARRVLVWLTLGAALPLVTFGPAFLEVWIGPDMRAAGGTILIALAVGHAIISVTSIDAALIEGCGRPDLTTKAMLAWAVLSIGAGAIAYPWLQTAAIAVAVALWLAGVGITNARIARRMLAGPAQCRRPRTTIGIAGAVVVAVACEAALAPFVLGVLSALAAMLLTAAAVLFWGLRWILLREDRRLLALPAILQRARFAPAPHKATA